MIRKIGTGVLFLMLLTLNACKDDPTKPEEVIPAASSISGRLTFLDGTPGVNSRIQLTLGYTDYYDTTDANGNFSFTKLQRGSYRLIFKSTNSMINTYQLGISLSDSQNVSGQNLYIRYNILDDFRAITLKNNDDVVLMQLQPDGSHVGNNYSVIKYFSGFFRNDRLNRSTLNCEVYLLPDDSYWDENTVLSADFVKNNFQYVMNLTEEPFNQQYGTHEVRISGDQIPIILSNPGSGFVFVKNDTLNRKLQIPCVDFSNNDFGFVINYK